MGFEIFKHKKEPVPETPKKEEIGGLNKSEIAAGLGLFFVIPNVTKAEVPVQDKMIDGVHSSLPEKKDVTKDAKAHVLEDKEGNESKEKMANLALTQEALAHVGQGGYVSNLELMKGCVLIAENREPSHGGSFSSENAIQVKVYKASLDKMDGYKIMNVYFDGKSLNENSSIHVESRISKTVDPIGLSFTYGILREKMNPQDIKKLLETANPGLNVDLLITALEQSKINSDQLKVKEIDQDIAMLKQAPQGKEKTLAGVVEDK